MSTADSPVVASATQRSRIEWIDTDAAGIYHNSTVTRLVEAAEATLTRERGLDGYFPVAPRVRFEADFEAPLFFGQEVTTTVSVTELGTSSMTFAFEVWGEAFEGAPRERAARGPLRHGAPRPQRPGPSDERSLAGGVGRAPDRALTPGATASASRSRRAPGPCRPIPLVVVSREVWSASLPRRAAAS